MKKAWKAITYVVGNVTIIGFLLIIILCIIDYITRKPIGYSVPEDYDDEDYFDEMVDLGI